MQPNQVPWARWAGAWIGITFWLGFAPVLIAAGYYAIKNPSDFDPALKLIRANDLVWTVRIGSTSYSRRAIGVGSLMFGVNAYNPDYSAGQSQVWNGALYGAYQATYLAWFRGAHSPTVFTVSRNVKPDGEALYGVWRNGSRPIIEYLWFCVLGGVVGVLLFEVLQIVKKRWKARVADEPVSSR
jgi:hypothetical protein